MAKTKTAAVVQHRTLYSRVSFLHQAATYLATVQPESKSRDNGEAAKTEQLPLKGLARRLTTDLRSVSLKTRIRLTPAIKHTVCKFCDTILIEGKSCSTTVENRSRGGKKPWADVLVRKCDTCGRERRYPINAPRPKGKVLRGPAAEEVPKEEGEILTSQTTHERTEHKMNEQSQELST